MINDYKKAFTLIELLVVIAIISLLSTVAVISIGSSREKAKFVSGQSFESSIQRTQTDSLVGEWLFDEGSGVTTADSSGNNHVGTIINATRTTGLNGGALNFVGNGYVLLGNDPDLNPSNFTITAWIKPGDYSGVYNFIYSNARDCCGVYNGINLFIAQNILYGSIWNGAAVYLPASTRLTNAPVWSFVSLTYDGKKLSIYLNGHLEASVATTLGVGSPASYSTYIGALAVGPGSLGFNGTIDQVRLYSVSILASNIEEIYLAEKDKYLAIK